MTTNTGERQLVAHVPNEEGSHTQPVFFNFRTAEFECDCEDWTRAAGCRHVFDVIGIGTKVSSCLEHVRNRRAQSGFVRVPVAAD